MKTLLNNNRYIFYLLILFAPYLRAQSLDDIWFNNEKYSSCYQDGYLNIMDVNRNFDIETSTYFFNMTSISNLTVSNLNKNGTMSSASTFQLKFGFQTFTASPQQFCPDIIEGCPIKPNTNFTIQRAFNLSKSRIPLYPLADITAQYSAVDAESNHLVCVKVLPVGYQHPIWKRIFTYIPMSLTVIAAIVSLVITTFSLLLQKDHDEDSNDEYNEYEDSFFAAFNYTTILFPDLLRLKTPGFFDLIYYVQFIVVVGQFNLDYPKFHALFTSNFAWSFLIWKTSWINNIARSLYPTKPQSSFITATISNYTLYDRQANTNGSSTITSKVNNSQNEEYIQDSSMTELAAAVDVDINALFLTMVVYLCLIIAIISIICFCAWIILQLLGRRDRHRDTEHENQPMHYSIKARKMRDFSIGIFIRIVGLVFLPLLTQSFYQLMIPSVWYITLCAAILLVGPLLMYGFILIKLLQIRPTSLLFTELKLLLRYGSLYNTYTDESFQFFIANITYSFIVAVMIGLFQTSSMAQLILVIGAELALTAGIYIKWPYSDSQVNLFHLILGCIKAFTLGLNITYLPQLKTTVLLKQYMGYIQMGIHSLVFFVFLVLIIKNIILMTLTDPGNEKLDNGIKGQPLSLLKHFLWRHNSKKKAFRTSSQSAARLMRQSQQSTTTTATTFIRHSRTFSNQSINLYQLTTDSEVQERMAQYYGVATLPSSNNTTRISLIKPDEIDEDSLQATATERLKSRNSQATSSHPPRLYNPQISETAGGDNDHRYSSVSIYRLDENIIAAGVDEPLMPHKNDLLSVQQQVKD